MLGALVAKLGWLYWYVEQELTWRMTLVYGVIILLSWLINKLLIFPNLSSLRKMPGRPVTWRNVIWGQLPEVLTGDPLDLYYRWTQEMKTSILRYRMLLGDQRVLVADPEAVKQIMVAKVGKYPRPRDMFRFFVEIVGDNLLTLEGHAHSVQRRLCNNAFKLTSVQGLLPTFQKHVEKLCSKMEMEVTKEAEGTAEIEIQSCLANMTFDIISQAGFGHETDALMNPREKMSSAFTFIFVGGKFRLFKMFFPRLYSMLPLADNRMFRDGLEYIRNLIRGIIDRKRKVVAENKSGTVSDLLEMLLSATDVESGAKLSQKQLQDLVMAFMLAGHETTASSLTWILLSLATHPDIQTKAREEVTSYMPPSGDPVKVEALDHMTYIDCIVKEGLRLFPPGPMIMREAVQDDVLCGYPIPKGTIVTISLGALHRNPAYWEDPDEFKPERFLDESKISFFAYQPFICGPHTCIGNKFALQELRLALALLLQRFEFSRLPDVTYRKKQAITLQPDPKLTLRVRLLK